MVNVEANNRLFQAAKKIGVQSAVLLTSYFHPLRPEMSAHPYVASRIASEDALSMSNESFRVVILQPPMSSEAFPDERPGRLHCSGVLAAPPAAWRRNQRDVRSFPRRIIVGSLSARFPEAFLLGREPQQQSALRRFGGRSWRLPTVVLRAVMGLGKLFLKLRGRESGLDPVRLVDTLASDMFFDAEPSAKLWATPEDTSTRRLRRSKEAALLRARE